MRASNASMQERDTATFPAGANETSRHTMLPRRGKTPNQSCHRDVKTSRVLGNGDLCHGIPCFTHKLSRTQTNFLAPIKYWHDRIFIGVIIQVNVAEPLLSGAVIVFYDEQVICFVFL